MPPIRTSQSASLARADSWQGHKRSFDVCCGLIPSEVQVQEALMTPSNSMLSSPKATQELSVAHAPPRHWKSPKDMVQPAPPNAFKSKADYGETYHFHLDDHTLSPSRVIRIPDISELEEIPDSQDEARENTYGCSAVERLEHQEEKPAISLTIKRGRHHEVWDPEKNDLCTIEGQVMYLEVKPKKRQGSPPRLVSLYLQLQSQLPMSRVRRLGERGVDRLSCPLAETITRSDGLVLPSTAPKGPRRCKKITSETSDGYKNAKRPYPAQNLVSQPTPVPTLTLELGHLQWAPGYQFAEFTARIPVGTGLFESNGAGSLTRFFNFKAKAVSKYVALGSVFTREFESKEGDISISVLKRGELMDGQESKLKLTVSEESRRALLRIY